MAYLSGKSVLIRGGQGLGYSKAVCQRLIASNGGAQSLQDTYEGNGGYRVPGGILVGRVDGSDTSPGYAETHDGQTWFKTSPDPEGTTGNNNYCHLGREYLLTDSAQRLLYNAAQATGSYKGYQSSRLWLEKAFGPKLLAEVRASAQREVRGREEVQRAARDSKRELAARKQRAQSGLGWDLPPWLLPVGVLGVGLVWWQRRK